MSRLSTRLASHPTMEITLKPTYKQHLAYEILKNSQTTYFLYGGAGGGGKSWLGCEWLLINCIQYPGIKAFIAREKLKVLKNTTLLTFYKVARYHEIKKDKDFRVHQQESYIEFKNGSRIDLLEVKLNPSDPMYEDMGSSEYTIGWLEEAGEINFAAFDTLKTRVGRHMNDQYQIKRKLLITCNPKKNWLYEMFYLPWKENRLPPDYAFLQAFVDDNTYNEADYKQALMDIKDPIKKQRLLYGMWEYDAEPGAVFDYDALNDLWTNAIIADTNKYLTIDVARHGKDRSVFYFWEGMRVTDITVYEGAGIDTIATNLRTEAATRRIAFSHIAVDEDGVGGGVVDLCRGVRGFINNSSPLPSENPRYEDLQKQNFANLKAQATWIMGKAVENHNICIDMDEDATFVSKTGEVISIKEIVVADLQTFLWDKIDDDQSKWTLVPKDKIKERLGRSPDFGDAFIMRGLFELKREFKSVQDPAEKAAVIVSESDFDQFSVF